MYEAECQLDPPVSYKDNDKQCFEQCVVSDIHKHDTRSTGCVVAINIRAAHTMRNHAETSGANTVECNSYGTTLEARKLGH